MIRVVNRKNFDPKNISNFEVSSPATETKQDSVRSLKELLRDHVRNPNPLIELPKARADESFESFVPDIAGLNALEREMLLEETRNRAIHLKSIQDTREKEFREEVMKVRAEQKAKKETQNLNDRGREADNAENADEANAPLKG